MTNTEQFLEAWLQLTTIINNERLSSDLPYNESMICNILFHVARVRNGKKITATDLCQMMQMKKSQMNRTLVNLEKKGMITRTKSEKDRRFIYIDLNHDNMEVYEKQHEKILKQIDYMSEKYGEDKMLELMYMLKEFTLVAQEVLENG